MQIIQCSHIGFDGVHVAIYAAGITIHYYYTLDIRKLKDGFS